MVFSGGKDNAPGGIFILLRLSAIRTYDIIILIFDTRSNPDVANNI